MKKISCMLMAVMFLTEVYGQRTAYCLNEVEESLGGTGQPALQSSTAKISESFETWPPVGWTFESPDGGRGWGRTSTANYPLYSAGNYAAYADYQTGGSTYNDQWLISPAVTISSGDYLSFWLAVQESKYYKDKVEVRISTGGNKPATFTTILETINIPAGSDVPWTRHTYNLSAYIGKTIYIAIRENVTDNKTDGAIVMVDLFRVGSIYQTDLAVTDLAGYKFGAPELKTISANVLNLGLNTVTSARLNYQINNGAVHSTTLTGLTITPGKENILTSSVKFDAKPGSYFLKLWISNVVGTGNDADTSNDTLNTILGIAFKSVPNTPLFEEFTSSTCGPCAGANQSVINPFITNHKDEMTIIKYQMNWPGTGDPYYTPEGGTRRYYYGINGVPSLFIGGKGTVLTTTELTNSLNTQKSKETFFSIYANHYINATTKKIDVHAFVVPYLTSSDFKINIAVVENVTTGNVKTNGETEFYSVMMKMIPDGNGVAVDFKENKPVTLDYSVDLGTTKIEQFTDLKVVVFIQHVASKEVFQSEYSVTPVYERLPLVEEFTSSTCAPCASFNTNILNPFINAHPDACTLIKYQMSWPSPGDPYYTSEGGTRRNFYGLNGIPALYICGDSIGRSTAEITSSMTNQINKKSSFYIESFATVNTITKIIEGSVNILPNINSSQYKTHIAVVERKTTGNVKTNGEKEFYHVMMKMIPDGNGTTCTFTEKVIKTIPFKVNLSTTHVEDFKDLKVVVFIQNTATKEVVQSSVLDLVTGLHNRTLSDNMETLVYPNPFSSEMTMKLLLKEPAELSVNVYSPEGRLVNQIVQKTRFPVGTHYFRWNGDHPSGQKVPQGLYFMKILTDEGETVHKVIFRP